MSALSQVECSIAIETHLGAAVLRVRRCSVLEQIGRLFQIELDLISDLTSRN